jgi:hypothetical protein
MLKVHFFDMPYVIYVGRATAHVTKCKIKIIGSIMFYKIVLADYTFAKRTERWTFNESTFL